MSWEKLPAATEFTRHCEEWDALNLRLYGAHPFRDSRFVGAMLRHFGKGTEQLCIHRTGQAVDGMLLLAQRRPGVWTQFVPAQAQAAPVLIENKAIFSTLFPDLGRNTWLIELLCQDPEFAPAGLLENSPIARVETHALTMNVDLQGSFDEYWLARSKNLVKNMRRYQKRINDAFGHAELRRITDPESMRGAVIRYGELESAGWKGQHGTAVHINNTQGLFYSEVLARFAETGQAEVAEYWLGDKLAASRLMTSGGGMTIILKTAYDEQLSKFAPGRALLKDLLEQAFLDKQVNTVEFYTDATADQLAWASRQRHICHVMLFRTPYLASLYDAFRWLKQRLTRRHAAKKGPIENAAPAQQVTARRHLRMAALPADCAPLFRAGEQDSFDLSADWFNLLESAASPAGSVPAPYTLEQNGATVGILPLYEKRGRMGTSQLNGLTNFYSSLYRPLVAETVTPEALGAGFQELLTNRSQDIVRFDAMDPTHPSFGLLESALRYTGFRVHRFFCFGNWYLPVEGRSFQTYFQSLPSQVRNTVKRREKKFFADGHGRLEIVTGEEKLLETIHAWGKIYDASWKRAEPFPELVPGLIRLCAQRGWLRLGLAYYDGEPIAAQLWIVNQGRASIYKLAYDEAYARFSAGTVLTAHMLRQAFDEDRVREIDYLIGDDLYKQDWMSHRRERWGLIAYNPRSIRGIVGEMNEFLRRAAKKIFPSLHAQWMGRKHKGCYIHADS